jgi:hypothetical protein
MDRPDVMRLFATQHWVAHTSQLRDLDVSEDMVYRARRRGVLASPVRNVVALAAVDLDLEGRAMAAQLAVGAEAFVSGTTAGVLHGLRAMPHRPIEVTVREDRRVTLPDWGRLVRTSWIDDDVDIDVRASGLRVARPLRMLFRLAKVFNQHRFERAAEDVWLRKLATPDEAATYLTSIRRRGLTGVARFETWLQKTDLRPRPSQSGLELDFVDVIERLGLPTPARQHPLRLPSGDVIHIDLAWPHIRLGVEPGHSWWHGGDLRAAADSRRDRACDEVGWRILRYTEDEQRAPDTLRELRAIYRQRAELWHASRAQTP